MIVDCHTHVFPPDVMSKRAEYVAADPLFRELYADPRARLATADNLLASMDTAGVDLSIALGFAWADPAACRRHNEYLLDAAARSNGRLVPFATVQPAAGARQLTAEVSCCARSGARGLGELRPDSQGWDLNGDAGDELAKAALENDLVLLFHVSEPVGHSYPGKAGLEVEGLLRFVERWPAVRVIAAHWGGGLPFYALMPEVRKALANVWFDTAASSLLYDSSVFGLSVGAVGADRVLIGSDYPLLEQGKTIERVRTSGLTAEDAALVLGENARKLLGL